MHEANRAESTLDSLPQAPCQSGEYLREVCGSCGVCGREYCHGAWLCYGESIRGGEQLCIFGRRVRRKT